MHLQRKPQTNSAYAPAMVVVVSRRLPIYLQSVTRALLALGGSIYRMCVCVCARARARVGNPVCACAKALLCGCLAFLRTRTTHSLIIIINYINFCDALPWRGQSVYSIILSMECVTTALTAYGIVVLFANQSGVS